MFSQSLKIHFLLAVVLLTQLVAPVHAHGNGDGHVTALERGVSAFGIIVIVGALLVTVYQNHKLETADDRPHHEALD